jgi:hypothetical protein
LALCCFPDRPEARVGTRDAGWMSSANVEFLCSIYAAWERRDSYSTASGRSRICTAALVALSLRLDYSTKPEPATASPCHYRLAEWIDCRSYLRAKTDQLWLNLHAGPTSGELMTSHTFSRLLTTYVGQEWTFSRLRATGAVAWSRAGLPS